MTSKPARIWKVDDITCHVDHGRAWPFAQARRPDIAAHWAGLQARHPRIFDGRVLLAHHVREQSDGLRRTLESRWFETDYSAFMAWRDFGWPDRDVVNGFAMAALRASDGAHVLAVMGEHTANPGRIYFAAGTPDPEDVIAGRLDISGNVLREMHEETGLRAHEVVLDADWTLVELGQRLAFMKTVRVDLPGRALAREIEARIARQDDPELAGMYVVESLADLRPDHMPDFILAYLRNELAGA